MPSWGKGGHTGLGLLTFRPQSRGPYFTSSGPTTKHTVQDRVSDKCSSCLLVMMYVVSGSCQLDYANGHRTMKEICQVWLDLDFRLSCTHPF